MPDGTKSTGRVQALDGLRGIAILVVMVFHFGRHVEPTGPISEFALRMVRTGWLGVDVFFVLSGFLITGILLEAKADPHYFRNFYMRRVLRIFPLYYGMVLALVLLSAQAASEQGWLWSYLLNLRIAIDHDFGVAGRFTTHLWSLSVEEQFYLVWPLMVWWLPSKYFRPICLAVALGSIAIRLVLLALMHDSVPYVLPFSRVDGMAIGAWLASAMRDGIPLVRIEKRSALIAILVCAIAFVAIKYPTVRGFHVLLAVGTTAIALVTAAAIFGGITDSGRVLSSRFLVTFGKYSYGLYVLHVPVREWMPWIRMDVKHFQTIVPNPFLCVSALVIVGIGSSFILAYASWHLFEKRFLSLKRFFPHQSVSLAPVPKTALAVD